MITKQTPWGPAQSHREFAPGIDSYTTASHGGIELTASRRAAMPEPLRSFTPFSGLDGWFEEDVDWAVVALAFHDAFTERDVYAAVATAEGYRGRVGDDEYARRWTGVLNWLDSVDGEPVRAIASQWKASQASRCSASDEVLRSTGGERY